MLFYAPNAMAKGLSKHEIEHLRQLCALNTMVGTAPSCTKTAGLFGKGSEEHGQTMPAVLVPNGQNFWASSERRLRSAPQASGTKTRCRTHTTMPYAFPTNICGRK